METVVKVTEKPHELSSEELELEAKIQESLQLMIHSDFETRWEVGKILPKLGKRAIAPLKEILEDNNADLELRWFAGRILSQFDDPTLIISFLKLLTEEEELSLMAIEALGNMGNYSIIALSNLLQEENNRLFAVQALARIRNTQTIEPLLTVVNDSLPEVRAIAIEALGTFHDDRIIPVLVEALTDKAARVRKEAVDALGRRKNLDLVEKIKPLLYDWDYQVCQTAAIALGRMGTDEAASALFRVLKSPATPASLKLEMVRGLSWIETITAIEYLQQALAWSDIQICQEIVTVLGRYQAPELRIKATQILIEFLHSGQIAAFKPQIKQIIAMSLGELGEVCAINSLLELAADTHQNVRLHAIAALKKFPSLTGVG